ncbi:hypothetical protein EI42_05925 [Thermosporothrix hazakensis]|jgi:hypothetical protein|uniref:Uncharacterized protein n=1 Tax=Thermosporothrix hazakensis TaxID=644383 RepID=A0A326TV72_THEHA|nr:hypothetical protein [Thermosporothrix hazakensis]PZW20552.1 hypothetical protein EI42_05925 [Thermosporothrix hazakensis]GCE51478.1 hypothetical protein KTH_63470 [Thermosporothrix hazakensis]
MKKIQIDGISEIEEIVAIFSVWSIPLFAYAQEKVKIVRQSNGKYRGIPMVKVKCKEEGKEPVWVQGQGTSVTEALENTIRLLFTAIIENEAETPEDFEWIPHYEF